MISRVAVLASTRGSDGCACHATIDRPEASKTSSARTIRWPSPGRSRAAAGGSRAASLAWSAGAPSTASLSRQRSRTAAGTAGISEMPSVERAEIKPGAADENRWPGSRRRRCRQALDIAQPGAGGIGGRRMDMAVEQMRRMGELGGGRPRRQHVEHRIDLHGIGVDDDAAVALGDVERQRRLAAGGRPGYQDRVPDPAAFRLILGFRSMPLVATLISHPTARALSPSASEYARAVGRRKRARLAWRRHRLRSRLPGGRNRRGRSGGRARATHLPRSRST